MELVVLLLVGGAATILALVRGQKQARRRAALIRLASALGLEYAATDIFDDRWEPFRLFGMGRARGIQNVVYGSIGGVEARVFDYWYRAGPGRSRINSDGWVGQAMWQGISRKFSCAVAALPASCPSLVVEAKNASYRMMELAPPPVPFESEAFNRRFHVRCEDPRFAVALLDARVMEALLEMRTLATLQVSEDRLLLVARELRPARMIALLRETSSIASRVPRVLGSLYPLRPGFN